MMANPQLAPPQPEDCLLERKTKNDLKDLLKTMIAFANSVKRGHVATTAHLRVCYCGTRIISRRK